jgi:hypothetical protein
MIETIVHARLVGHAGLSALMGSRWYPALLPQAPTYPAGTYQVISDPPYQVLGVEVAPRRPRVQLTVWSTLYSDVAAAIEQARAAFDGWSTTSGGTTVRYTRMEGGGDLYDPETGLHGRTLDIFPAYQ